MCAHSAVVRARTASLATAVQTPLLSFFSESSRRAVLHSAVSASRVPGFPVVPPGGGPWGWSPGVLPGFLKVIPGGGPRVRGGGSRGGFTGSGGWSLGGGVGANVD